MKIFLIIAVVAVIAIAILVYTSNRKADDTSRPSEDKKPLAQTVNDKIILVDNVTHDDIKKALTEFCNLYNKSDYAAMPRLWKLTFESFAITFPYDVDFITYCFAVNFLKYPMNITWNAQVRAWATTNSGDEWITDKSVNKAVMLYLAEDDKEYDNVFLTTKDNIGYKLGFASSRSRKLLDTPNERYKAPSTSVIDLKDQSFEDLN